MLYRSRIKGLGFYVPENVVTNDDLSKLMDTSDEWIQERTGIQQRRHALRGSDTTTSMGVKASLKAIEAANINKEEIDFIVFATRSPDFFFPGCGVLVQKELGLPTVGALDIRNQCSGFIYALSVADQYIKTGMYKNILVIGAETQSPALDMTTRGRNMAVLFGDGAGAAIVSRSDDPERGILSTHLHSQGEHAEQLAMITPGVGTKWVTELLAENDPDDVSYYPDINMLIPHQANLRISQFVQHQFKLTDEQIFNNIMKYGNTTAASIPIALTEAVQQGKIRGGDLVVLAAFGSGFTWASAIIRW